jgi:hypothetical protein
MKNFYNDENPGINHPWSRPQQIPETDTPIGTVMKEALIIARELLGSEPSSDYFVKFLNDYVTYSFEDGLQLKAGAALMSDRIKKTMDKGMVRVYLNTSSINVNWWGIIKLFHSCQCSGIQEIYEPDKVSGKVYRTPCQVHLMFGYKKCDLSYETFTKMLNYFCDYYDNYEVILTQTT